jgi:hypothetical protein
VFRGRGGIGFRPAVVPLRVSFHSTFHYRHHHYHNRSICMKSWKKPANSMKTRFIAVCSSGSTARCGLLTVTSSCLLARRSVHFQAGLCSNDRHQSYSHLPRAFFRPPPLPLWFKADITTSLSIAFCWLPVHIPPVPLLFCGHSFERILSCHFIDQ